MIYIVFNCTHILILKSPIHDILHLISQILLFDNMSHLQLLLQPLHLVLHRLFVAGLSVSLLLHHPHLLPQLPVQLLLLPHPLLQLVHLQDLPL